MPTSTYEKIQSVTVTGSTQSSLSFTVIPGTYTDLVIQGQVRTNRAGEVTDQYTFELNSDTGSNYSSTTIYGNGSSANSTRSSSATNTGLYRCPAATASSGMFGPVYANFMNYSNSTTYKTIVGRCADHSSIFGTLANVSLWRNTASITSIVMKSTTGNSFVQDTVVTLYGIKAA